MRATGMRPSDGGAATLFAHRGHLAAVGGKPQGNGQGSNSASLRQFNERVIIKVLRCLGQASKAELARMAGLSGNTAGRIVRTLVAQGLIREQGKRSGGLRGQPATLLGLDPKGAYAIGLCLDHHRLEVVVVDFTGSIVGHRSVPSELSLPDDSMRLAAEAVRELALEVGSAARERLVGIGVAMPYNPTNRQRASALTRNQFDVEAQLRLATGQTVIVENDGTAAAAAELFDGHGREIDNFLYVFIDEVSSGGVIRDGDYHRGAGGNGGDVGLMPTARSSLPSARAHGPDPDSLLARASIAALVRHLRFRGHEVADHLALQAWLERPAPAVLEWLEDCAQALVVPILSAVRLLDVPHVVLDGDLPRDLLTRLVDRLASLLAAASAESRPPPNLLVGKAGRQAPLKGAAILPFYASFSPSRGRLIKGQV